MQQDTTVLGKVFDSFLEKLRTDNVFSPAVIARLKDLLGKRQLKAESIKKALFAEDNLPTSRRVRAALDRGYLKNLFGFLIWAAKNSMKRFFASPPGPRDNRRDRLCPGSTFQNRALRFTGSNERKNHRFCLESR